jgi:MoxR-like ATPase
MVLDDNFGRIQFTPDLVPADLLGTRIYNGKTGEFITELGPVFANLLLADEINRAPAKVQSALLEVMQERQVTIGKQTYSMPDPFLVLATQNPIESDGTYPLPEAQLDRFMFKVIVDYPEYQDELVVMERMVGPAVQLRTLLTPDHLRAMQQAVAESYIDPRVSAYAATLVQATRYPANLALKRSPRRSRLAAARGPRSTWCLGREPWPSCGAGATPCPRTWRTSSATCCATAWCSATRGWPAGSHPRPSSARCWRATPHRAST